MRWEQFLQRNFSQFALLLVAFGFLTTVGELFFTGHTNGVQAIGFYAACLGTILAIHGCVDRRVRRGLAIAFLLLSILGLLSAYKHYEARTLKVELATLQQLKSASSIVLSPVISRPMLAPFSISGLSFFAVLILLARVDNIDIP